MTLELVTAGESHGPALIAILTGLPAGLMLESRDTAAALGSRSSATRSRSSPAYVTDARWARPSHSSSAIAITTTGPGG
jgi:chorismate synthase